MKRLVLELAADEATLIIGALNVSATLRNVIAPVTTEQLAYSRAESALGTRVLLAMAARPAPAGAFCANCTRADRPMLLELGWNDAGVAVAICDRCSPSATRPEPAAIGAES